MPYTDFTLENVDAKLGLTSHRAILFPNLPTRPAPPRLGEVLARGMELALVTEKARSEFLVAPILLAARELAGGRFAILSGHALDVDPERKLTGECEFILTLSDTYPVVKAPLVLIAEAKRHDFEAGIGQCIAQMFAAQTFNDRAKRPLPAISGCVTTGGEWQFLRLDGTEVTLDRDRIYITTVEKILAMLVACIEAGTTSPLTPD